MRSLILLLLPFLALFFQTTLFRAISIHGVVPDLLLILVIFYAVFSGSTKGAVYGAACGLWEDLYLGRMIGISAISKGITAYIMGKMEGPVFKDNILVGIIGVVSGTIINSLIIMIVSFIGIKGFGLDKNMLAELIYQGIYNTIIATPIYIWYFRSSGAGLLKEEGLLR